MVKGGGSFPLPATHPLCGDRSPSGWTSIPPAPFSRLRQPEGCLPFETRDNLHFWDCSSRGRGNRRASPFRNLGRPSVTGSFHEMYSFERVESRPGYHRCANSRSEFSIGLPRRGLCPFKSKNKRIVVLRELSSLERHRVSVLKAMPRRLPQGSCPATRHRTILRASGL